MAYENTTAKLVDWMQTSPTYLYSVGLYTHSSGDYYLIRIHSGKVYAAKLYPRAGSAEIVNTYTGPSVRNVTVGEPTDIQKHEAYILSRMETISAWVELLTLTTIGFSLIYGWNFNWSGDKATIVLQEQQGGDEGGAAFSGYIARRYELTITEDVSDLPVATVTLESSNAWQPRVGEVFVWYPNTIVGGLRMWRPHDCDFLDDTYGSSDETAPVYAAYKADGTLSILEYFLRVTPGLTRAEHSAAAMATMCASNGWMITAHPGTKEDTYSGPGAKRTFGFTVDGVEYPVESSDGGYSRWQKATTTAPYGGGEISSATYFPDQVSEWINDPGHEWDCERCRDDSCTGGNCWWELKCTDAEYHWIEGYEYPDVFTSIAARIGLVIPWRSTESFYIIQHETGGISKSGGGEGGTVNAEIRQLNNDEWYNEHYPVSAWFTMTVPVASSCNSLSEVQGVPCGGEVSNIASYNETRNNYTIKTTLVTPYETEEVDTLDTEVFGDLGEYHTMFYSQICYVDGEMNPWFNLQAAFGNSIRTETPNDTVREGSNNIIGPEKTAINGIWLGAV